MVARSNDFWKTALFLSKYGVDGPPIELSTPHWYTAYRMFYEQLGGQRTIEAFEHSLKNARDSFDSHLGSGRIGWRDAKRNPGRLNDKARMVMEQSMGLSRAEFWDSIRSLADLSVEQKNDVFDQLDAQQRSEKETGVVQQTEGGSKVVISIRYERSPSSKKQALDYHGYDCAVCGFNFERTYGSWGKGFAEVHHMIPLAQSRTRQTDHKTDLVVVCANCHRMIHRKRNTTLTIEELKAKFTHL